MANIWLIVGSLRRESINLKIARALMKLAKQENLPHQFNLVDNACLPLYNEDLWEDIPAALSQFKITIKNADTLLFITPECNRLAPIPFKQAGYRGLPPSEGNNWQNKPAAMLKASPEQSSTPVAQTRLRRILLTLNSRVMGHPEIYLQFEESLFNDNNEIASERTRQFLLKFLNTFNQWIDEVSPAMA